MRFSSFFVFVAAIAVSLAAKVPAQAHGVRHQIEQVQATVVTLTYDNGEPFVGARFEAEPLEANPIEPHPPVQRSGWTDEQGRAIILADRPGQWQIRASANDGHGARVVFDVGANGDSDSTRVRLDSATPAVPKWLGFVLLAAVFVVLRQLLRMRSRKS